MADRIVYYGVVMGLLGVYMEQIAFGHFPRRSNAGGVPLWSWRAASSATFFGLKYSGIATLHPVSTCLENGQKSYKTGIQDVWLPYPIHLQLFSTLSC
jgi:hypothetical protein